MSATTRPHPPTAMRTAARRTRFSRPFVGSAVRAGGRRNLSPARVPHAGGSQKTGEMQESSQDLHILN